MRTGVIAKKMGMTRLFQADGRHVPVTVLQLEEAAGRRPPRDGPRRLYRRPARRRHGQGEECRQAAARAISARPRSSPRRSVVEFRVAEDALLDVGATISADHFVAGQMVDVSGVTQGKGFAGAMKRWGFGGLRATHGVSVSHRSHGSTGNRQDPGKRLQEQEDGRPHGCPQPHPAESRDRPHRRRAAACCSSRARCPGHKGSWLLVKDAVKLPRPRRRALSGRARRAAARQSRPRRPRPAWSRRPRSTKFRRCRATRKSPRSPPSRKPARRRAKPSEACRRPKPADEAKPAADESKEG